MKLRLKDSHPSWNVATAAALHTLNTNSSINAAISPHHLSLQMYSTPSTFIHMQKSFSISDAFRTGLHSLRTACHITASWRSSWMTASRQGSDAHFWHPAVNHHWVYPKLLQLKHVKTSSKPNVEFVQLKTQYLSLDVWTQLVTSDSVVSIQFMYTLPPGVLML